jgi:hypothetical protein
MKTLIALINFCISSTNQLWAIFIVIHLFFEKPITKEYIKKAHDFVRGIWLPTGSNYLLFSGESPGKWTFNRLKTMFALHNAHWPAYQI